MYSTISDGNRFLPGVINSGSSFPAKTAVNKGDKFYKIVPKGENIKSFSPYFLSEIEYSRIKSNPSQIEQKLGLPLSSVSSEYDVFIIISKVDNNQLFESVIAPTKQFFNSTPNIIYKTIGGAKQSLIINNTNISLWEKSITPIGTLSPQSIPQIGN